VVFQLSFVPEFYDFVAHRNAAKIVFQYLLQSDVLNLSRRFGENTLAFAERDNAGKSKREHK
jgi:hypothetical protein